MRLRNFILVLPTILLVTTHAVAGFINGDNAGSGVFIQVEDPAISNGAPVRIGSTAAAAGFIGVNRGQVTIEAFAAANGTPLSVLEAGAPIWTGLNSSSAIPLAQGTFAMGNPFNLPNTPTFDGTQPIEMIFYAYGGNYSGWSAEATGIIPGTNSLGIDPVIFGTAPGLISSFILTGAPAPDTASTLALGGIGFASLVFFSRRRRVSGH